MHANEITRIASSELVSNLYGDLTRYKNILSVEKKRLLSTYPDTLLNPLLEAIDTRVINLCPMVLCATLLKDIKVSCPDTLLAGIGLGMFSISTHDDIVDELPRDRGTVAGLVYAGNIVTLEGLKLLVRSGHEEVVPGLVDCINENHYYQTKIVKTLWEHPTSEAGYLNAIRHTGYWIAIGLNAALTYSGKSEHYDAINKFAMHYGLTCQIIDDMREIPDDRTNGYWSLPLSIAKKEGLDLDNTEDLNTAISRSGELAAYNIEQAKNISKDVFPGLFKLVTRIENVVKNIQY